MIHDIKHHATDLIIPVHDQTDSEIGRLIPLTISNLSDSALIDLFAMWRNRDLSAWLDQRPVSHEGTRRWLENLIKDDCRMAFLIFNQNRDLIGRIGFLDLEDHSVMIDSIIRGLSNISPGMMTHAFFAMTAWLFQNSSIVHVYSKVLPDNAASMKLHHALGFQMHHQIYLTQTFPQIWSPIDHEPEPNDSNPRLLNIMCLTRSDFNSQCSRSSRIQG